MMEIEIAELGGQCLDRRIGERDVLISEVLFARRRRFVPRSRGAEPA